MHGDPHSNKLLLSDVKFAIMNSQEPIVLDGMKFFPLTYSTVSVVSILVDSRHNMNV